MICNVKLKLITDKKGPPSTGGPAEIDIVVT